MILSGETGINVSTSATMPVEGYILDTINFAGGGTYTTGVLFSDNKASFRESRGISNSTEVSYYTMNNNATPTVIAIVDTAVKVLGTTVSQDITQRFTNTANKATYVGALSRAFQVSATLTCESGNNNQIGIYIAKNGTIVNYTESYITTNGSGKGEGAKVQGVIQLSTNDFIEIYIENSTATNNITVTNLTCIIKAI